MKEIFSRQNSPPFLAKILLIHYYLSGDVYHRALVDESWMIVSHMGTLNILENGRSAWGALYDTTP
jgi:hypothetical protein